MKNLRGKKYLPLNGLLKVYSLPDTWLRLEHISKLPDSLKITFGIYLGQHGKKIDTWEVLCRRVREAKITDIDGGGIALYSSHPAGQQYTAPRAKLSWNSEGASHDQIISAIYQAHIQEVDDWIPFDRYAEIEKIKEKRVKWKGPVFLLQAYAKALQAIGLKTALKISKRNLKTSLKVLHFGESYIVATMFKAQQVKLPKSIKSKKSKKSKSQRIKRIEVN